jgi:hypothetical protein
MSVIRLSLALSLLFVSACDVDPAPGRSLYPQLPQAAAQGQEGEEGEGGETPAEPQSSPAGDLIESATAALTAAQNAAGDAGAPEAGAR